MKHKHWLCAAALTMCSHVFAADEVIETSSETTAAQNEQTTTTELTEQEKYQQWAQQVWESLDRQTGEVSIDKANAKLNIPDDFYFLNAKDATKVLVDVWGNPPEAVSPLGMIFPAEMTPFDPEAWAVTIEYEEDGYVSDEDAADINYADLLKQMQADTAESSKYRVEQGYAPIELIGWAAQPYYDEKSNKLHWAKEIKFGDNPTNTLNYNIRVLGRKGVLVLNFIAGMEQQALIDSKLNSVLAMAEFDQGSTYADFDPDMDEVAAYGLGALVAGKVVAKTGLIAGLILLLKKFGIYIVIGIGALAKGLWSRRKKAKSEPTQG